MRRYKKIFRVKDSNISEIPPDTEWIDFDDLEFKGTVTPDIFPPTTKKIRFNKIFYQPLKGLIPEGVEHIELGFYTDVELDLGDLPNSLLYIRFDVWFTNMGKPLKIGVFPNHLKYLNLGSYNQILTPGIIPNSVTKIVFEDRFNQPLLPDSLPKNLKHLVLGKEFNQPILNEELPSTLIYMKLGKKYTCDIDESILNRVYINLKIFIENDELYEKTIEKIQIPFHDYIFNHQKSRLSFLDFMDLSHP